MTEAKAIKKLYRSFDKYRCFPRVMNLLPWECDFTYVTSSGYLHEIEIKNNLVDLKRDFKEKTNKHFYLANGLPRDKKYWTLDPSLLQKIPKPQFTEASLIPIASLSYAIEKEFLFDAVDLIPDVYGIYIFNYGSVTEVRPAKRLPFLRKITDEELQNLYTSTHFRYWDLFKKYC